MTFTQTKWSLADLYPGFNTPELESAYDNIEEQVTSFEGLRANLTPDMPADRFLDVVRASEEMTRVAHKLYAFAGLSFSADTQDQTAQSAQTRVQQFLAEMENRTLFFSLWWKDLDDDNAKRLMDGFWRLPLLPGGDAPFQAAYPQRAGRESRQP